MQPIGGSLMKIVPTIAVIVAAAIFSMGPALADNSGKGTDQTPASSSGASHGAFADQNGNFGFLGDVGGTPGYHDGAVGQDPGATGYNNSHVVTPPTVTHK
jgi:hypothetical protein